MSRRKFIQNSTGISLVLAKWIAPVVAVVQLPVHAQTSTCSVVGTWHIPGLADYSIIFNVDGTGEILGFPTPSAPRNTFTWIHGLDRLATTSDLTGDTSVFIVNLDCTQLTDERDQVHVRV